MKREILLSIVLAIAFLLLGAMIVEKQKEIDTLEQACVLMDGGLSREHAEILGDTQAILVMLDVQLAACEIELEGCQIDFEDRAKMLDGCIDERDSCYLLLGSYMDSACMSDLNCATCLDQTDGDFDFCTKNALYP